MKVICPICRRETEYEGNPYRPFCSERCRLIDLGKWLNEDYRIPVEINTRPSLEEEKTEEGEKNQN